MCCLFLLKRQIASNSILEKGLELLSHVSEHGITKGTDVSIGILEEPLVTENDVGDEGVTTKPTDYVKSLPDDSTPDKMLLEELYVYMQNAETLLAKLAEMKKFHEYLDDPPSPE